VEVGSLRKFHQRKSYTNKTGYRGDDGGANGCADVRPDRIADTSPDPCADPCADHEPNRCTDGRSHIHSDWAANTGTDDFGGSKFGADASAIFNPDRYTDGITNIRTYTGADWAANTGTDGALQRNHRRVGVFRLSRLLGLQRRGHR
jgi:hypothetical protein